MAKKLMHILVAAVVALVVAACGQEDGTSGGPATDDNSGGKADQVTTSFEHFRSVQTFGPCPPDMECSGFIELYADGKLRVDRVNDLSGQVYEATVSDEDMSTAIAVLTDEELVSLLKQEEAPCILPTDIYEAMELTIDGETYRNSTTFCDAEPIAAARELLGNLVEKYIDSQGSFERFRISQTYGPCPPETDCSGYIELHADGKLRVDRVNDLSAQIYEATVSEEDMSTAIAILTAEKLVELLKQQEAPCVQPTDIYEDMELTIDGETHRNSTTFCDAEPIATARELLGKLVDKYIDSQGSFERFRISQTYGPCPPDTDCSGYIELHADGKLRVDRVNDMSGQVYEATVSEEDMSAAIATLTAVELVNLLKQEEPPCVQPTDIYEDMELTIDGETHRNSTTFCDAEPIATARELLGKLVDKYIDSQGSFERFRIFQSYGPCPPETDCSGYIELHADGKLRVDRVNDMSAQIYEATVSEEDLREAIAILTAEELVSLLQQEEAPCVQPTDIYEEMELTIDGETHSNSTTFCDAEPIAEAREVLDKLIDKYISQ